MITKSNWQKTRLGDIADEIIQRVDNPSQSKCDRFVGLEHFISGDLKIKKCGNTSNLVSAMKIFHSGDILFARRNAYLKRASLVDFDGVCSGDAFVIREKDNMVIPGFLAFIFNSDSLWNYAISHAAGTMSKRVKWRDLEKYTFMLPSLDEQKRIADLLWSVDDVSEKYIDMVKYVSKIKDSILKSFFEKQSKLKRKRLEDITSLITKGTTPTTAGFKFLDKGINFIKAESMSEEETFLPNKFGFISKECHESFKRSQLQEGDVLFSIAGVLGRCAMVTKNYVPANINQALALIRLVDQGVKKEYVLLFLTSQYVLEHFNRISVKTAQANINLKQISDLEVPIPDLIVQNNLVDQINKIRSLHGEYLLHIRLIDEIKKSIINQIFG